MRVAVICSIVALAASACAAPPPPPPPEPPPPSTAVRDSLKSAFDMAKNYVTLAAEQVPVNRYTYRPTPEVRTFAQLFGHIANANGAVCSAVSGEASPAAVADTVTAKADLQKALADSFALCDRAFAAVNDASGEALALFGGAINTTRLGALPFATAHTMEHYGNIVTYMRLNKMVPPSSQ